MKSEQVVRDIQEYLVLFGSRHDPLLKNKIKMLSWVLQNDLPNPLEYKPEDKK